MPNINVNKLNNMTRGLNSQDKKEIIELNREYTIQKNQIKNLNDSNKKLASEINKLKKQTSEASLKTNPIVKKIINTNNRLRDKKILNLEESLKSRVKEINELKQLVKIKPLAHNDFNNFIADSVKSLQGDLSSDENSAYDFIIRDVEIEALVSTENRGGKMIFIIPTSTQLKDIEGSKLQKLKYSLRMVPKIE